MANITPAPEPEARLGMCEFAKRYPTSATTYHHRKPHERSPICADTWKPLEPEAALCNICGEPLPAGSKHAVHEACAEALRMALADPPSRTLGAPEGQEAQPLQETSEERDWVTLYLREKERQAEGASPAQPLDDEVSRMEVVEGATPYEGKPTKAQPLGTCAAEREPHEEMRYADGSTMCPDFKPAPQPPGVSGGEPALRETLLTIIEEWRSEMGNSCADALAGEVEAVLARRVPAAGERGAPDALRAPLLDFAAPPPAAAGGEQGGGGEERND